MKIGYSNFLQEYVPADMVDYGDCATFQIVCPNCREAVFKVHRQLSGSEYLAHYKASKAQVAECELRVGSISKQDVLAHNFIAKGQHLKLFQAVLRNALLDKAEGAHWSRAYLENTIESMIKRPAYRNLVRWARDRTTSGELEDIWEKHEQEYRGKSEFYKETQLQFAKDMLAYTTAPNSFMLYAFALSLAVIISMGLLAKGEQANNPAFLAAIGTLITGSDRDLQKAHKVNEHMLLSVITGASLSLRSWLVVLPYMDILKQHMKR